MTDAADSGHGGHRGTREVVVLRPLGTPLPLGFAGLAVATTAFSLLELGAVPTTQGRLVAWGVLAFAVPLQALAAVVGMWARDPVAGTGIAVQAGLWSVTSVLTATNPPGATRAAEGVLLLGIAVVLLVPAAGGVAKPVAAAVFVTTSARAVLLGLHHLTGGGGWQTAAGVVGLALGVLALYAALAFELEGARGHAVLPLGRPRPVVDDGEPGVRPEL